MSDDDDFQRTYAGESYAQAFNIRKTMYRLNDLELPFKRGIRQEQFLAFLGVFILSSILLGLVISPLFNLLGLSLGWQAIMLFLLGPPIFASIRIGKPMPHNKTITGFFISWVRARLDDPVHRAGVPYGSQFPSKRVEGNYLRTWAPEVEFATDYDPPAADYSEGRPIPWPVVSLLPPAPKKQSILESDEDFRNRIANTGYTASLPEQKTTQPAG